MKKSMYFGLFLLFGQVLASEHPVETVQKEAISVQQPAGVTVNVTKEDIKPTEIDNTRIAIAIAAGYFTAYFFAR